MTKAIAGTDYVGVGVGAIVVDEGGKVFLSQRGPQATNERGSWEFPGGKVEFGDTLRATLKREFLEEYGMTIDIVELLSIDDHILPTKASTGFRPPSPPVPSARPRASSSRINAAPSVSSTWTICRSHCHSSRSITCATSARSSASTDDRAKAYPSFNAAVTCGLVDLNLLT